MPEPANKFLVLTASWVGRHKRLLAASGLTLVLFIFLNYVLLPLYVNHGSTLIVPDVVGKPVADAQQVLLAEGLEPVQADTRPDSRVPVGSVLSQNPQADAVVKHGRRVYLTVSGGEQLVAVPQLRGKSPRDAKFTLERNGLVLGSVDYTASELYPENTIIGQTVQQGVNVPKGSIVGIVVSQGKPLSQIAVPDLIGKSVTEAERLLSQRSLKLGNIAYQVSFDLLPNTIVDQFPRGGDSVAQGRAVDLFVIKAGKPKEEFEPSPK
jgi:serine/threonine-protein kinase